MANQSIYDAFEQMWEHTKAKLNGKANASHTHATTDITSGILGVARGGTGASTLTSGAALIGNGTGAVTTRAITNNTALGHIAYNTNLMTTNTLAYWNGAYASNGASNLAYCKHGAFGTIVTKNTGDYAAASHTHSQYYQSGSTAYHPGISLDTNGAYIYGESNSGNILFRYRATSTSGYSYTNIASIVSAIGSKLPLSGGTLTGDLIGKGITATSNIACGYISFSGNKIGCSATTLVLFSANNTNGILTSTNFRPNSDKVMSCGTASYKWKQLYAGTTTINTSDRNQKKDFKTFDSNSNYEKFFMDLKPMIFKFKDGESGRDHFGFISQDIEDSLYKFGFNDKSFAGFCKDVLTQDIKDEEGNIIEEEVPKLDDQGNKQYIYGLRYNEFTALNTYMIQKSINEINSLKEENQLLRKELQEIKNILNGKL